MNDPNISEYSLKAHSDTKICDKVLNLNESTLSEEQREIFDKYIEGANIFITGPGGCGKSHLIKNIVKHASTRIKYNVAVTAMTGCAAVLLECCATTIHSWAGIGIAKADDDVIINRISTNIYKKQKWKNVNLLIIDEVSMMSKRIFNLLDAIGKNVRKNRRPFGGIQVIFCGDFYQLPPVGNSNDPDSSLFCFESDLWNETFDYQYILDKSFRQQDNEYINILNQVRNGKIYNNAYKTLKSRVGINCDNNDSVKPVILHPTKSAVDKINNTKLTELTGEHHKFDCTFKYEPTTENLRENNFKTPTPKMIEAARKTLLNNGLYEESLTLKIGSQVMCIANVDIENGLCNGSVGIVSDISSSGPTVTFKTGLKYTFTKYAWESDIIPGYFIQQYPLILAWSVTIHKSQGSTLESAEINIGSSVFAEGQTYVALSRVKSLNGLYLKSFNPKKIKTNKKVIEFYKQFECETDSDNET